MKSIKQLWEEVEQKANNIGMDLETEEFKLLAALASRVHEIEIKYGFIVETAPGEFAPGSSSPGETEEKSPTAGGIQTATDLTLAAAGSADPAAGDQASTAAGENKKEPVWDGRRHV